MMKVNIKLYSILTQDISEDILNQHPKGIRAGAPFEITMPAGSTLSDLVAYLSLPEDLVKITFVNGIHQKLNFQLQPGDQVGMFPPIAGG
ncbi:MAG: MoaD/ThiS family protein [Candidatus Promineifilaceae bacterium]